MKLCIQMFSRTTEPQFQSPLDPSILQIILIALLRLLGFARRWPLPPTWFPPDWLQELRQTGFMAALTAEKDLDPAARDTFALSTYRRAHAAMAARFREEWAYQSHRVTPDRLPPGSSPEFPSEPASPEPSPDQLAAFDDLRQALDALPETDQVLIIRIFTEGSTESQLARSLNLTRRAVSKRKQAILLKLRKQLSTSRQRRNVARL